MLVPFFLSGCTVNPQDLSSQPPVNISANVSTVPHIFTMQEIAQHNTKDDCWMVIDGKVLNLTGYSYHPGGDTYVPFCGTDATAAFNDEGGRGRNHSQMAFSMLDSFTIGEINNTGG